MVMLAEHYNFVIGGDPDRDTIDLAVLDTSTGGVRAYLADRADAAGYRRLLMWARLHAPGRRVWALEGTGSFAARLATVLAEAGEDVMEITGGRRPRRAKNDRIDAIAAARTALASERRLPHERAVCARPCGRFWSPGRRVLVSRTKAINELKSLIVVAPEQLRAGLRSVSLARQLDRVEALTSPPAARVRFLFAQTAELDPELLALVKQHPAGPALLAEPGGRR